MKLFDFPPNVLREREGFLDDLAVAAEAMGSNEEGRETSPLHGSDSVEDTMESTGTLSPPKAAAHTFGQSPFVPMRPEVQKLRQ